MNASKTLKADKELQIVWAEVWVPNVVDAYGDFMTAAEIRDMAYRYLAGSELHKVDINHDNDVIDAYIVESFIAREGDPDFIAGAWVVAVHVKDATVWLAIKNGELNGFSMEADVVRTTREIEIDVPEYVVGKTDDVYGHSHAFKVFFDEKGQFIGGVTNIVDGHSHKITRGTVTETAGGHDHRFSYVEGLNHE